MYLQVVCICSFVHWEDIKNAPHHLDKTEDNQIDKAELHFGGGGGSVGHNISTLNHICNYV